VNLSTTQHRRLVKGDFSPLDFPYDPDDLDHGRPAECCVVLEWEPARTLWDHDSSQHVRVPRQPLLWIETAAVQRHRKGFWRVQFHVTDLRHQPHYMARGGSYTTSRFRAIDELEVVPREDLDRYAKGAYDRDAAMRLERAIAARQQWRRTRRDSRREFPAAA
jgi:hypothetical protein